jgi:hypothetical protein
MTKEAMKLALEALETERDIYREHDEDGAPEYILDAITAIKEALAEHAMQERGAWQKQLTNAQRNELKQIEDGTWEADRNG